ncbi:putative transposase [Xanthomonas oryzae pv. oryzae KACC 10331]|uniref:Transposase n=1 Tax=Xanthomonas oryzae pv. oryzae (strain KACC10331 / KXO85) TaxID=291331 RepID=Q5H166_XANOR|nr:putative transposase [Xanthomonas oryzae pv. oryzae KACC 10331]
MKKRDGRLVSRAALEEMRLMALQRMGEGESLAEVASSFGLHRGWAYKVLARAQGGRRWRIDDA